MKDLSACLSDAGFGKVQTVLNTGNVVCDSYLALPEAVTLAENVVSATFGYPAKIIGLLPESIAQAVDEFPWDDVPATSHRYLVFGDDEALLQQMFCEGSSLCGADERLAIGKGVLYWVVPKGETLGTELSKLFAKAKYKKSTTIRNLNTVEKLLSLAK